MKNFELTTPNFIRMITTIILSIAMELLSYALKVLASKLVLRALFVFGVTEFSFVRTVTTIVVMIT